MQNILALRFGNSLFEPIWNAQGIDHVQITISETVGLEGRAGYYDDVGALRDMLQNHMLQLLALIAMEPPARFDGTAIRDEKVKVLRSLRKITPAQTPQLTVTGQYGGGAVKGKIRRRLCRRAGQALEHRDLRRAQGACRQLALAGGAPSTCAPASASPSGDRRSSSSSSRVPHSIFAERGGMLRANALIIRLQPEEYVRLLVMAKQPGLDREGIRLREVPLNLSLETEFASTPRRIAYERLLLDLIEGDPTLFVRRDEVEAQWEWIDAIRAGWKANDARPKPIPRAIGGRRRRSRSPNATA